VDFLLLQGRLTVVGFHFTHSQLREQPAFAKKLLGKYQIPEGDSTPFRRPLE